MHRAVFVPRLTCPTSFDAKRRVGGDATCIGCMELELKRTPLVALGGGWPDVLAPAMSRGRSQPRRD